MCQKITYAKWHTLVGDTDGLLLKLIIICTGESQKGLNLKKQSYKFESDLKFTEIWNCIKFETIYTDSLIRYR